MSNTARRKKQFKAALAYEGMTQTAWAKEQETSVTHLWEVLNERRTSIRLNAAINALIAKHAPAKRVRVA